MTSYLNGFLLLIPIFLWNIIFIKRLPQAFSREIFWKNIPPIIGWTENGLRIFVFALPLFMSLSLETEQQRVGLWIYLLGISIYFASWIIQIYFRESRWSKSMAGFMAPAYTTLLWFVGIGLFGQTQFVKISYFSAVYFSAVALFVIVHSIHAYIVFKRLEDLRI
ncbi:MAG: hypothetical protein K9H64_09870 [Bacteroidales bacterium]|nr:hypothetical protein [Bacteroidales bacterium]MCF8456131.1 hypothetical protein [Bacteroidales bacterium]